VGFIPWSIGGAFSGSPMRLQGGWAISPITRSKPQNTVFLDECADFIP
jgi:hypothetical protein